MKSKKLLLIVAAAMTLSACSKTPYLPYHSTADIPRVTNETRTEMKQVKLEGIQTNYAVIAAVDDGELGYLLFAPEKNADKISKNFWDYDITYSTAIPPEDIDELISATQTIIKDWDTLSGNKDGVFYEYSQTLEPDVYQASENVIGYRPAVHIYFNITEEGSTGRLIIGEGVKRTYSINSREEVQAFQNLLKKGKETIIEMSS